MEKIENIPREISATEAELREQIAQLRDERKAVILSHNYQLPEVQDAADFVGDSLELSRKAAATDAEVIVFAGVHFMAETAAILAPEKSVLLPELRAGCPLANMISPEALRRRKAEHPDAAVVTYVNSTAAVKAESDYCCTSANALKVVEAVPNQKIIFAPDRYLGAWVSAHTDKEMILWPGYCPTHSWISPEEILAMKQEHPEAPVIAHPECTPEVTALADQVLSTSGMCRFVNENPSKEFIIGTEEGLLYRLQKENPDKQFYLASPRAVCPNMKMTGLEKVLWCLQDLSNKIEVDPEIAAKARGAIDRMLEII